MDSSCNQVRDISCNLIQIDLSNNAKASYCSTCNKLQPNTLICYHELCTCPLTIDQFNGLTGVYSYIDCSNIAFLGGESGPTGPTGPTGPVGPEVYNGPTGPTGFIGPIGQIGPTGPTGQIGIMGEIGPTGHTGQMGTVGEIGPTGATGQQGNMGEIGPIGLIGPTGGMGPTGATGQQGNMGEMGLTGPIGATGQEGTSGNVGPTGPTGPSGNTFITNGLIYQSFITAYSLNEQTLSVDEPITFDTHSVIFGECLHEENTPDLWFWNPGNYMVSMNICSNERGQFSLIKNLNYSIPGGTVGINTVYAQTNMTVIMLIEDTDLTEPIPTLLNKTGCRIQVVNTSSLTDTVTLYGSTNTGNPMPQITASITIIRLTP